MSIPQQISEPSAIYAGDTINWLLSLADYPATGGWTLHYNAVSAAGRFELIGSASGANHLISANSASTGTFPPGDYSLTKYVSHADGSRVTLAELSLTVKANLAAKTVAFDTRGHAKKVLDAIEAVLEGRATTDQEEITINGKSIKRTPIADLLSLRSQYQEYYRQEQAASRIASGQSAATGSRVLVRFN